MSDDERDDERIATATKIPPRGTLIFGISFIAGISIWIASRRIADSEPWDLEGFYYVVAMLCTGVICGALAPRSIWLSWVGMYAGQFLGTLLASRGHQIGSLAPLGWFCILPIFSLTTVAGAAIAAMTRMIVAAIANRRKVR